jgi:carbon starvation protein CstA
MTGHFIPLICVTITCGMLSGFHSTQSTIIGRAVKNEKDTLITFSLPMLAEGVFAMI